MDYAGSRETAWGIRLRRAPARLPGQPRPHVI